MLEVGELEVGEDEVRSQVGFLELRQSAVHELVQPRIRVRVACREVCVLEDRQGHAVALEVAAHLTTALHDRARAQEPQLASRGGVPLELEHVEQVEHGEVA